MENLTKSKRIFYFDALRALAISCVVIVHVYALTGYHMACIYPNIDFDWFFTQVLGNPFRIGVDLFLMLSGALSMGRDWDIKTFLGKRIPRICLPFIFWNIVLISAYIYFSYMGNVDYVQSFDLNSIFSYILTALVGRTTGFGPNWFFWMILGTYFIMPIINKWLYHSEMYEAEYFLVFWLITSLFDFTLMTSFPIKLNYFTSPIGLVVLGYYLRHTERKIFKSRLFNVLLILVPAAILLVMSYFNSSPTYMAYPHRYSILLCLEVSGIFLLFRNTEFHINEDGIVYKIIFALAKYSYGIYIFHYSIILYLMRNLIIHTNHSLYMVILIVLTLSISIAAMAILNRIPYLNQVIGAK